MLHGMLDGQSSIGNISMPVTPEKGNTHVSHSENDMAVSLPTAVAGALDQSGKESTMATCDASPRNVNPVADAAQDQLGVDYYYMVTLKIFGRLWIRNLMNFGKRMKNN